MGQKKSTNKAAEQHIILKHLRGSKAGVEEKFLITNSLKLLIGRDETCQVRYDPDSDDLVSRTHAKIEVRKEGNAQISLTDLGSSNGTFLNRERIVGETVINSGDRIQLGPAGPEFSIDIYPPSATDVKKTRLAGSIPKETRLADSTPSASSNVGSHAMPMDSSSFGAEIPPRGVGRQTVWNMVAQAKTDSRRQFLFIGGVLLIALVFAGIYINKQYSEKMVNIVNDLEQAAVDSTVSGPKIAEEYRQSVVFFEAAWQLIHAPTNRTIYHYYYQETEHAEAFPAYIRMANGDIEPILVPEKVENGQPIGNSHRGTGFVISQNGFILTNRHVATAWKTAYRLPPRGILLEIEYDDPSNESSWKFVPKQLLSDNGGGLPESWVPDEAQFLGKKPISGKILEGKNTYLDLVFARSADRIPGRVTRVSNRHDVALVKIDVPEATASLPREDAFSSIQQGEDIFVLGYPAGGMEQATVTKSQDIFNTNSATFMIPHPTIAAGIIGKILKFEKQPGQGQLINLGDYYQISIPGMGAGASGAPVFNKYGKVVAIYTLADAETGTGWAVPIKYGNELIDPGTAGK